MRGGAVVAARRRGRGGLRLPRLRQAPAAVRRALPGTGFLSLGLALVGGLLVGIALVRLLLGLAEHPAAPLAALAWALLGGVTVIVVITVLRRGEWMSDWVYWTFVGGLLLATAIDLLGVTEPGGGALQQATAALAAGAALLSVMGLRRTRDLVAPLLMYALLLIAAMLIGAAGEVGLLRDQLPALAAGIIPPAAGSVLARDYRRIVHVQLDRLLVQSAASGSPLPMASSLGGELARLDLAAEELLEAVAAGRLRLPLPKPAAAAAAELATELRLHLLQGRRETWLVHAIRESALLADAVDLTDPHSLAALLSDEQRDGLLAALWQLAAVESYSPQRLEVVFEPAQDSPIHPNGAQLPIGITVTGLRLGRIPPAVWQAIERVGVFTDAAHRNEVGIRVVSQVPEVAPQ